MRFTRLLLAALIGLTVMALDVGVGGGGVVEAAVSEGPPVCPPGGNETNLACTPDSVVDQTVNGPWRVPDGRGYSAVTFTRGVDVPACPTGLSTDCYVEIEQPTYRGCIVMTGESDTDFRECNRWLDDELGYSERFKGAGNYGDVYGGNLACFGGFNGAYAQGGPAPDDTWPQVAPRVLPCTVLLSTQLRPIRALEGPTWLAFRTRVKVCDEAGEAETGNGNECKVSHWEVGQTWVRLLGPEEEGVPTARCSIEQRADFLRIVNQSSLTGVGTLETFLTLPDGSTSSASVVERTPTKPGDYVVTVTAGVEGGDAEDVDTCSTRVQAPQVGGEMRIGGALPGATGLAGLGTPTGVTVELAVDRYGVGPVTLTSGTVRLGEGGEVVGSVPSVVGEQLTWLGGSLEVEFDVRVDSFDPVDVVFEAFGVDAAGGAIPPVRVAGSIVGTSISASGPVRLLDTRPDGETIDGQFEKIGLRDAGSVTPIQVTGRAGIPESAAGATIQLTAIRPVTAGYATLFPCSDEPPNASSLNFTAASVLGNSSTVALSAAGEVCLYTSAAAQYTLDFTGYLSAQDAFEPIDPTRVLETRTGVPPTFDGVASGIGRRDAGSTLTLPIAGRGDISEAATAVAITVAAVRPAENGFVTLYPCGADRPTTSSLNFAAGVTTANFALVALGDGDLCVYSSAATDLTIDVTATVVDDPHFAGFAPARLVDSRPEGETVDSQTRRQGRLAAGSTLVLPVAGRGDVPSNARAVVVNLTAIRPDATGYITAYPCDGERPTTSALNYSANAIVGSSSIVGLDATAGTLCIYTFAETDLTVDVSAAWIDPTVVPL